MLDCILNIHLNLKRFRYEIGLKKYLNLVNDIWKLILEYILFRNIDIFK